MEEWKKAGARTRKIRDPRSVGFIRSGSPQGPHLALLSSLNRSFCSVHIDQVQLKSRNHVQLPKSTLLPGLKGQCHRIHPGSPGKHHSYITTPIRTNPHRRASKPVPISTNASSRHSPRSTPPAKNQKQPKKGPVSSKKKWATFSQTIKISSTNFNPSSPTARPSLNQQRLKTPATNLTQRKWTNSNHSWHCTENPSMAD